MHRIRKVQVNASIMVVIILNNKNLVFLPLNVRRQIQAKMITMLHKILLVEYHPAEA